MNSTDILTAEQFVEQKYDLPEGGRWTDLDRGKIVTLSPPDEVHGNVVLNLSKALAEHLQSAQDGYACFELGLILARDPDTIRCPAVSYFQAGERFAETDKIVTTAIPALVVEIASTNDRRQGMPDRIAAYLAYGVEHVWLIDTEQREVHICRPENYRKRLMGFEILRGNPILSGFEISVEKLFAPPPWYQ